MRHCHLLRVFTRGEEGGNHLGVVTDVAGLDECAMQAVAAGLGFSETIFVDAARGGVPRVRIFTPAAEIPFAGHPLVGAAWVLSTMGPGGVSRVACGIGEVPFRVEGDTVWIEVGLPGEVEAAARDVAGGPGLPAPVRAWWVSFPLRYLILELGSAEEVVSAEPDMSYLAAAGWDGTYLFARSGPGAKARFFAPALGVPEDPATGSAAVALAAVLAFAGEEEGALIIEQGDEVGAPSRVALAWGGEVASVGGAVRRDGVRLLEA